MTRRQVDGVLSVKSEPVTRRVPGHDRLAFARGLRIRLKLDDVSYENARMFLFPPGQLRPQSARSFIGSLVGGYGQA